MRPWASTSDGRRRAAALLAGLLCAAAPAVSAAALVGAEDALGRAFPAPLRTVKKTAFLDAGQVARIERESGAEVGSKLVAYYVASGPDGTPAGWAYVDTHLVRTLQETVLVVLGPDLAVRRIEVLAFHEPREYLPAERWRAQFEGRHEGRELALGRGIRGVAGATLSSRAITDAVRRVLATHRAIHGGAAP